MKLFRICLVALFFLSNLALAQSFYLRDVVQEVFVQADGTLRVEDTRSIVLQGDFMGDTGNTYFVEVDPARGGQVSFGDFAVLDDGERAQAQISGNEISWRVRGMDETRRFRFSYTLTGELEVATDIARLRRQFLETSHARVEGYTQIIHPPAPSPEQFKVFIFTESGRIGTLDFAPDFSRATVELDAVQEDERVRTAALLDAALFDFQTIDEPREQMWLDELGDQTAPFREESARILQDAEQTPVPPFWYALIAGAVAALAAWVLRAFLKHGREPAVQDIGPYYREPAEEIPPAAVPFLLTQNTPGLSKAGPAIAATLLDFARRGFLSVQTEETAGFMGLGRDEKVTYHLEQTPDNLTPFEAKLWRAFEGSARGSGTFDADDLKRYFEKRPSFGQSWVKSPRAWYEKTHGNLLDEGSSHQAWLVSLVCFGAAGVCAFAAFSFVGAMGLLGVALFIAALLCAILGVIAAASLRRWQPDKLLNVRKWEGYRKFLSDFSLMRESPAEHYKLWDYHFVYATALGVSKSYLKNLQRLMSAEPDKFSSPLWIRGGMYPGDLGRIATIENMEGLVSSLNTLSQIETNLGNLDSALSPKSSTGGGFSGGGFSGGGGGGFSGGGGGGSGMR